MKQEDHHTIKGVPLTLYILAITGLKVIYSTISDPPYYRIAPKMGFNRSWHHDDTTMSVSDLYKSLAYPPSMVGHLLPDY